MTRISEPDVLDLLARLVEKSLVVYEEDEDGHGRYRLLETVRQYARDRLLETGEAERCRDRHRDCFLRFAEQAQPKLFGEEQVIWLNRLEVDHDNLRAALEWCGDDPGGAEPGLRLSAALWRFWWDHGHLGEGRRRYEAALSHAGASARTPKRAAALIGAGIMAQLLGDDYPAVQKCYAESLAICEELGDERGIAVATGKLGDLAMSRADHELARRLLTEALEMHRRQGNRWYIGQMLVCLGLVASDQEDWVTARACFEECLAVWRGVGDRRYSHALNNLATVATRLGDLEGARALLEAALKVQEEAGDEWVIPRTLVQLGIVVASLGDRARGCALLTRGVRRGQHTSNRWVIAYGMNGLADAAAAEGRAVRAARLWGAAEAVHEGMPPRSAVPQRQESRLAARKALGEEAFAAACEEGRAMTMEQAVAYTLEEERA